MELEKFVGSVQPPLGSQEVYKDDCMYCFNTCFHDQGINICLLCFQSFCPDHDDDHFHSFPGHLLFLNYVKKPRVEAQAEEKPAKMAKLEIKEKSEDELFELSTKLYNIETEQYFEYEKQDLPMSIAMTIEAVLKSRSSEKKEEIKAWEQEITACQHSFDINQTPIADIKLHECQDCDLKENLWICLQCGSTGCGRAQFGGVPGNSHAKEHFETTQHPIAIKLGSLTEDSADAYCYICNDEIKVPGLASLLETFNINISNFEKTEKSLTELQLEQNLKWDFNMDGNNGDSLNPVFGPELTGFKNLGNSCYLASVLQVLFSLPTFQEEFYGKDIDFGEKNPATDIMIQLTKIANGLISGQFSVPDESTTDTIKYQRGIKPSGFKSLVGKDHIEFSTMKQQDALEFWEFLLDKIDKLYTSFSETPTNVFKFLTESKLISSDSGVKLKAELNNFLSLPVDAEVESVDEEGHKSYKPITFDSMLTKWSSSEQIELSSKVFTKRVGFKTTPKVLVLNAQRVQLENWVPVKVDVPIKYTDTIDIEKYMSEGLLSGETLIEDDDESAADEWIPNVTAMEQLQAMGFPEQRCRRALFNTGNESSEEAMNWLFLHMEDLDIDDPFTPPKQEQGSSNEAPQELVEQIQSMGFSAKLATKALILNNNNPDSAINWIFENPDDDGELPKTVRKISDTDIISSLSSRSNGSTVYSLKAIICHKGSSVHSGHYVCFIKKEVKGSEKWVLFNDEKVVVCDDSSVKEMESAGYLYIFTQND